MTHCYGVDCDMKSELDDGDITAKICMCMCEDCLEADGFQ